MRHKSIIKWYFHVQRIRKRSFTQRFICQLFWYSSLSISFKIPKHYPSTHISLHPLSLSWYTLHISHIFLIIHFLTPPNSPVTSQLTFHYISLHLYLSSHIRWFVYDFGPPLTIRALSPGGGGGAKWVVCQTTPTPTCQVLNVSDPPRVKPLITPPLLQIHLGTSTPTYRSILLGPINP